MPLRKLYIELTSDCNLDCSICYRRAWKTQPQGMEEETLRWIAAEAARLPELRSIVLGGIGEPTVSPLFQEALALFRGKEITVTTNGIDLSNETVEGLARSADRVVFSVDGLGDTFRSIRGSELESVVSSARDLRKKRKAAGKNEARTEFQFVLSSANAHDLSGVVDLAADEKADALIVSHLLPQDAAGADSIMYGRWAQERTKELYSWARLRAMRRGLKLILPPMELKTERRCAFAEDDAAYITAEGDMVPCYRFAHDGTEFVFGREKKVYAHSFGRCGETPLEEMWNSPSYEGYRKTLIENRYPSCPDCDLLEGCNMTEDSSADCWSDSPSCADCLWARGFMSCP